MRKVFFAIFMALAVCAGAQGQNVQRKGNTFVQVSTKGQQASGKETKTAYTYTDTKGQSYPIYLSPSGKAFVKRVSKKSGNSYRQYLPEVGRQINPSAYEEKKGK